MSDQRQRDHARATEITRLLTEADAQLPAVGQLLPGLLGEDELDAPASWTCIRCEVELTPPERYACSACLGRDADGTPWIGKRPRKVQP